MLAEKQLLSAQGSYFLKSLYTQVDVTVNFCQGQNEPMTNKIKDSIAKSIKKPTKARTKKKSKIQPVDWYIKAAAAIAISRSDKSKDRIGSK